MRKPFARMRQALMHSDCVARRASAERIHQRLARTMQRVDSQFHGARGGHDAHEPYRLDVPAEFRQHVAQIWDAYLALQKASGESPCGCGSTPECGRRVGCCGTDRASRTGLVAKTQQRAEGRAGDAVSRESSRPEGEFLAANGRDGTAGPPVRRGRVRPRVSPVLLDGI